MQDQADQDQSAAADLISMVALQILARRVRGGRPTVPMVVNATESAWTTASARAREHTLVTFAEICVRAGVRPVQLLPDDPDKPTEELLQAAEIAYGVASLAHEELTASGVPLASATCEPHGRTVLFTRGALADRLQSERVKLAAVVLLAVMAQSATGSRRLT